MSTPIPSSSETAATATARTALLVEDDPRLRRILGAALRSAGFTVLAAPHYESAIRHLALHRLDVACIDVELPRQSGYELCEYLRGIPKFVGLPVIMTSERGSPEDMAQAEDAGGNAFLQKPFSMDKLARCVDSLFPPRVLAGARQDRAIARTKGAWLGNAWRPFQLGAASSWAMLAVPLPA